MKKLLIAGGGTGGHISPALAAGFAAEKAFQVSWLSTPRPVDKTMYSPVADRVTVMNPPRIDKGMKFLLPFTASAALFRAMGYIRKNRIDIVLGTGGYSAFFALAAARLMGKPAALFESNAHAGRSNRIASRFCRAAFTGLPGGGKGLKCTVHRTGTPVSSSVKRIPGNEARRILGIPLDKPVVLFLGGSQGASAVNDLALGLTGDFTVLLQCGVRDEERVRKSVAGRSGIIAEAFLNDLSLWYSAAELAVARAGGQTIAELSATSLPAVLVPFPYAAEDHQTANAAVAEKAGAAVMMEQKGSSPEKLSQLLHRLITNREELERMGQAMENLFPAEPAEKIVGILKEMVE